MNSKNAPSNSTSRITIDIPRENHRKLKAIAALYGKSMKEIVVELIENCLIEKIPNAETIKALKNAQEGKNLVKDESFEDFFKRFGV